MGFGKPGETRPSDDLETVPRWCATLDMLVKPYWHMAQGLCVSWGREDGAPLRVPRAVYATAASPARLTPARDIGPVDRLIRTDAAAGTVRSGEVVPYKKWQPRLPNQVVTIHKVCPTGANQFGFCFELVGVIVTRWAEAIAMVGASSLRDWCVLPD